MANQVLYGFIDLKDQAAARIAGSLVEAVNDAINLSVEQHNADMDAVMGLFVDRTTLYTERYAQVGAASLQPLDDKGRARPIKPSGFYTVAYPIYSGGSAWGTDYVTSVKMTVGDAQRATQLMIEADLNWMRYHIMAALFSFATTPFVDDLYGSLTIQPLALASDGVTYPVVGGSPATDTHMLAQANAIGASADNPYPLIYADLVEHPQNSGQVVAFIASSLVTTTRALATFHPVTDSNLQLGSGSTVVVGDLGVPHPGKLIGYEDSGVWIVEWPSVPAGYIIATMTGGDRPLAMREDAEAELQGFKKVAERNDHPFYESQFLRRAGFGARNRVGGLVYRIGNGTYDEPANLTPPI